MIEPQLPGLSEPPDPAAQAFEALRAEVALLRYAVTGLAAERASLEIPDYSETLAKITSMASSIGKRLAALSEMPAFGLSPDDLSREIAAASEKIRREDRETITESRQALQQVANELIASMRSARKEAKQLELLLWIGGGCFLAGIVIGARLIGPALIKLF